MSRWKKQYLFEKFSKKFAKIFTGERQIFRVNFPHLLQ